MTSRSWYHGTTAALMPGEEIRPGHEANFGISQAGRVYLTPVLGWAVFYACTVAAPDGIARVYEVKPAAARIFRDRAAFLARVGTGRLAGRASR